MSRFRETSELTALNRRAGTVAVGRPSPRLRRALVAADRARRVTGGRFDPRVLVDLDRLGYRGAALDEPGCRDPNRQPGGPRRPAGRKTRHERRSTASRSRRHRQGPGPALGGRAGSTSWSRGFPRSRRAATSSRVATTPMASRGRSASRTRPAVSDLAVIARRGSGRRHLVDPGQPLVAGRPGRPPSARPTDRRTGRTWPCSP